MKRAALYHADTNELEELPSMEKPLLYDVWLQFKATKKILVVTDAQAEGVKAYDTHLASLRRLPCSPQPGFKDGEIYVEGVDYVVKTDLVPPYDWQVGPETVQTAYPIAPVKSEDQDDIWRDVFDMINGGATIDEVEKVYIITKR